MTDAEAEQRGRDIESIEAAAEALLREHSDALVCGLRSDGLIAPIPQSVGLWGQAAIEGRAVIDGVVTEDRAKVVELWQRVGEVGAVNGKVRLLEEPSRWVTLHFLDLREAHEILLCVIIPGEEVTAREGAQAKELAPAAPRFCTLIEDESGNVLDCDEAFSQMFGYEPGEVIGKGALAHIHPEDQGRAVEGWLAMLATRRPQQMRCRRARKGGSCMWIDTTLHNYLNDPARNYVLVEIIDVSAEMAAQDTVRRQGELLRRLTEVMPVGLLQVDSERRVVHHNARLVEILACQGEEGTAAPAAYTRAEAERPDASAPSLAGLLGALTDEGAAAFEGALGHALGEGADTDVEVDVVPAGGSFRRALMSIRALKGERAAVEGAITCVLDITDSARARSELERRATFDQLTHTHNRSSILDALERELEAEGRAKVAVVYLDLDHFKALNDTHGHAAGDEALQAVAENLRRATRGDDMIGRLGGDEFLLLVRGLPEPEVAMSVADRIRASLSSPLSLSCGEVALNASIGVACAGEEHVSAAELVRLADEAMYRSKQERKGVAVLASRSKRSRPDEYPPDDPPVVPGQVRR